jgi:hypothetical protein
VNKAAKLIDETTLALVGSTVPAPLQEQELANIRDLKQTLAEVSKAEENGSMPPGERLKAERLSVAILRLTEAAGNAGLLAMAIAGSITQTRIVLAEFGATLADMDLDWPEEAPELSREARMEAAGITEQDIAETQPPKHPEP